MSDERGLHHPDRDLAHAVRDPTPRFAFVPQSAAEIVKQPVSQSPALVGSRHAAGLDNPTSHSYISVSTPAGPLSQDTLSLGGSFIGGKT